LIAATLLLKVCGAHLIRERDDLSGLGESLLTTADFCTDWRWPSST